MSEAMGKLAAVVALVWTACCLQRVTGQTPVLTNTSGGLVVGLELPLLPGLPAITQYLGIPYAEAPVGDRRFAKPVPKAPWPGVLNSTGARPVCLQAPSGVPPEKAMDEDCLTLNVYVSRQVVNETGPLPVMVFIHGGALSSGYGELYDGSVLALQGKVVVVNFNYRLGVFGFLSTGDDAAPGNYGLWDQRLALHWVRANAANFGGDPARVTIFGESAGAWSVSYQMATPLNDRSLFRRAVAQSGVGFDGIVLPPESAGERAWQLGSAVGCHLKPAQDSSEDLLACLRGLAAGDLAADASFEPLAALDGEFLPADIDTLLSDPHVGQYDLLIGANSQEGSVFATKESFTTDELGDALWTVLASVCRCDNAQELTDAALAFYFGGEDFKDGRQNVLKFFEVSGDVFFDVQAARLARRHAKVAAGTRTFSYYFTEETGKEFFAWPWVPGAPHALEITYVFGLVPFTHPNATEAVVLSGTMVQYWSRFAWNGDPNGPGLPEWPAYENENASYIILDGKGIETQNHFKKDKVFFWENYLPEITELPRKEVCSYQAPLKGESAKKPVTVTLVLAKEDGEVLGAAVGAVSVADEALGGEEVAEFRGVPYARPPLGELRFQPPQETGPWGDAPLDLSGGLPPACPQDVTKDPWMVRLGLNTTSEDCLTLNVFSPSDKATGSGDSKLPVLVVVHSGDGSHGTASVYDGVALASGTKAVVVAANYRLGALGFATTQGEALPGNYGLQDVLAALAWVQDYIGSFGGDAGRVTLLGHGAGARLVHYLAMSRQAAGLFGRAVLMSGTALAPVANNTVQPSPARLTRDLARALGCPTADGDAMLGCLREKPADDLVEEAEEVPLGLAFPVVVDGQVLTRSPLDLLQEGDVNDVDLLIGMARDEEAALASEMLDGEDCPDRDAVEELIRRVSSLTLHDSRAMADVLITEYLTRGAGVTKDEDCPTRSGFGRFLNDFLSAYPTLLSAQLHAKAGNSVYVYAVDHEPMSHYAGPLPPAAGPAFGDELQFVFGDPYGRLDDDMRPPYRLADRQFTLELMTYLKNFVHDGEPGESLSGVEWPAFDADQLGYASLTDCPSSSWGADSGWPRLLALWGDVVRPLVTGPRPPPPTCPPEPAPCSVGAGIGLRLTPAEAEGLIAALIGTTIAALILGVFLFGGCMAYRARAVKSEARLRPTRGGLPSQIEVNSPEKFGQELDVIDDVGHDVDDSMAGGVEGGFNGDNHFY